MKKLFILLVTLGLISCTNEDPSNISLLTPSDSFISSNVKFKVIDTISFKMSTFKIDSLATDLIGNILVGRYTDSHFGTVEAKGFINFLPQSYFINDDAVFDSIVLNLGYSGYYYNDTLLQKNIKVHQLSKQLKYRNNSSNFYNTTDIQISNLVGQRIFYPRISRDSIKITLDQSFGLNLFNKIKNGLINNNEELNESFKGLRISADLTENASIISFNTSSSYIRFYYKRTSTPDEIDFFDFRYTDFVFNKNHFSQIKTDRLGTNLPINFVNQENELNSLNTNNLTYIQAGEGIVTKIALPNFKSSMDNLNLPGTIFKAELKIPLDNSYYSKKLFTSDSLRVFLVDQNNKIINETRNAHIRREDPEFNKTYITMRIESYLDSSLSNYNYRNYGLILLPYNYGSETTRLILNDNKNSIEKAKLKITYLTYEN